MANISPKQRKEVEALVYEVMDALDSTRSNSDHYKEMFAKMSDDQFFKFISKDHPFKFYTRPFEIEPKIEDAEKALNILKVPLMEKIYLPYMYTDKNGHPVSTLECMVVYIHLKKVQQFVTKKNAMSVDISQRDMKTGLLVSFDKNGKTSDREMEALSVMGLDKTIKELSRPRADAMKSKDQMYNTINTTGMVSIDNIPIDIDDSLAKNMMNVYLIGSGIESNLVNQDYYLPHTLKNKKRNIERA